MSFNDTSNASAFSRDKFEAHRCCFEMSTYDIGACHLSLDLDKGWHASCEPQISVLWKDACSESCGYHGPTHESGHWFAGSALLLNNDKLAQGPSGFWKNNTTTIMPE
ncbi:hypothetical protein TSUD_207760 [Trifolium subterraneum]|uniref:Uncharacterized protein n=1 Tax=Trifolium subterraneum TaxID=3900 RepID=A0A2Z6NHA2_TRISU|nr:hypothetical protein TSUD_207760 [Trifolium subterraneum]